MKVENWIFKSKRNINRLMITNIHANILSIRTLGEWIYGTAGYENYFVYIMEANIDIWSVKTVFRTQWW